MTQPLLLRTSCQGVFPGLQQPRNVIRVQQTLLIGATCACLHLPPLVKQTESKPFCTTAHWERPTMFLTTPAMRSACPTWAAPAPLVPLTTALCTTPHSHLHTAACPALLERWRGWLRLGVNSSRASATKPPPLLQKPEGNFGMSPRMGSVVSICVTFLRGAASCLISLPLLWTSSTAGFYLFSWCATSPRGSCLLDSTSWMLPSEVT